MSSNLCNTQMEGDEDKELPKRSKPTNPSLPQELIREILVRLPVKYLLQSKCVSKDWLTLISSPEFVKTHLSFSANDCTHHRFLLKETKYPPLEDNLKHCSVSSLFNESVTEAFDFDYPMKSTHRSVRIVGSVNGLICLRIGLDVLVIWNPSTTKFKQVASHMLPPQIYRPVYGFGYDEVHDDYKIVGIFLNIKNSSVDAKIYSLKSDSWRSVDGYPGGYLYPLSASAKIVNGKLHWVTSDKDIITIDLVDEKFGKVEHPCYAEGEFSLKLGVLGGDFSVLCNYHLRDYQRTRDYQVTHADVWVMKEYGVKESWTKLYTIKCPLHSRLLPTPVFISNKGEILLLFKSKLMIYNPEEKSVRYPEITSVDGRLWAELCIESLVCPISQTEPMTQLEGQGE